MNVLGINAVYHETSAALVTDGIVRAAAEEERFNRRRHGAEARVDNADELPVAAIWFCLDHAGMRPEELDAICYSFDPTLRTATTHDAHAEDEDWGGESGERIFRESLARVQATLSATLGIDAGELLRWVPHHLAHAASSYYASPFEEADILVVDGIGERDAVLMAHGDGNRLRPIRAIGFPHSLGFVWEKLSTYLGFSEYDACKVMGLAAYGDQERFAHDFRRVLWKAGAFHVDGDILRFRDRSCASLAQLFGAISEEVGRDHADIAAALQAVTDEVLLWLVRTLHAAQPSKRLCMAGGVALNCSSNWVIKEHGPFADLYIPSAPHDAGTAVGAALYWYYNVLEAERERVRTGDDPYLGPAFDPEAVDAAIRNAGLEARIAPEPASEAASLLADGKVVGWFDGRMEFGPRALGSRSLLADPRDPHARDKLNRKVKHREDFRPFAPSVLAERGHEWMDLGRYSESYEYMLFACPVRDAYRERIPAVLHVDGTARVQLVSKQRKPAFHALISAFEQRTGVPAVLNTSFNDSEPIVCCPRDAVATFTSTDIDALVLNDRVVEKR